MGFAWVILDATEATYTSRVGVARVKLIGNEASEVHVLEFTDAIGDALDGIEAELKKRWWWRILWPVLLYGPFILIGIYLYQM
jgi:hypothetical protein